MSVSSAETIGIGELAKTLGIGVTTLRRVAEAERFPVTREGRKHARRFDRMELVEWMANRPEWHWALVALCGPLPDGWPKPSSSGHTG